MPQMRTSIKIRSGYRPAYAPQDGNDRCCHCSRVGVGWKGTENHSTPVTSCKLLGIEINPAYICREYKPPKGN